LAQGSRSPNGTGNPFLLIDPKLAGNGREKETFLYIALFKDEQKNDQTGRFKLCADLRLPIRSWLGHANQQSCRFV
jgi:hypothetical protein